MSGSPGDYEVVVEVGGKTFRGRYSVRGREVEVSTERGRRSALVCGLPAEDLARVLLSELVREGRA